MAGERAFAERHCKKTLFWPMNHVNRQRDCGMERRQRLRLAGGTP